MKRDHQFFTLACQNVAGMIWGSSAFSHNGKYTNKELWELLPQETRDAIEAFVELPKQGPVPGADPT